MPRTPKPSRPTETPRPMILASPAWVFELKHADGQSEPDPIRIRRFLKNIGRQYGLSVRWPSVEPLPGEVIPPQTHPVALDASGHTKGGVTTETRENGKCGPANGNEEMA